MAEEKKLGLRKIERVLISVSDKSRIVEFARHLKTFGAEIISTGGTAKALREAGIDVRDVSTVTGFPEIMDGRVKTLHPKIHGALLSRRNNAGDQAAMQAHDIEPIDMVVINLYPFEETIRREDVSLEEAIEQIDIGGPAMIRSAAKNFEAVSILSSPDDYENVIAELITNAGQLCLATRSRLAEQAFARTASYDATIFGFLQTVVPESAAEPLIAGGGGGGGSTFTFQHLASAFNESAESFPGRSFVLLQKRAELRYGENPHQQASLYVTAQGGGVADAELLSGKEMSFNNYVDADAAWQLVCDFDELACAIIKHTNPAGVAISSKPEEAYRKALATDPLSAFGGIVAFNRTVDGPAAHALTQIFTEVVLAPDFEPDALAILKAKKNLRVLRLGEPKLNPGLEYRQISGGMLVQTRDAHQLDLADLKIVSQRAPADEELRALRFAWTVCKHTKSNAIVYAREGQTVGVGAGQMSRVDSVKIGAMRAQLPIEGSVLASDAFFPFRDGIDEAATKGITAVIQPGGSMRDAEVIAAADEHDLAMVFTGIRHFKH